MADRVALYVLSSCPKSADEILEVIRASDYIDEINSGEGPREECGLYSLIAPASAQVSSISEAIKHLVSQGSEWNKLCVVVADQEAKDDVVYAISLDDEKEEDRLKCKAASVVEVAANLSQANMELKEFRDISGGADVFDAGR